VSLLFINILVIIKLTTLLIFVDRIRRKKLALLESFYNTK